MPETSSKFEFRSRNKAFSQKNAEVIGRAFQFITNGDHSLRKDPKWLYEKIKENKGHPEVKGCWDLMPRNAKQELEAAQLRFIRKANYFIEIIEIPFSVTYTNSPPRTESVEVGIIEKVPERRLIGAMVMVEQSTLPVSEWRRRNRLGIQPKLMPLSEALESDTHRQTLIHNKILKVLPLMDQAILFGHEASELIELRDQLKKWDEERLPLAHRWKAEGIQTDEEAS